MQAQQGGLQREGRAPLVLEHIQADGPIGRADVWMPAIFKGSDSFLWLRYVLGDLERVVTDGINVADLFG